MLHVALLALLAAAAPDTSIRVPGTTGLRFGLAPDAMAARGFAVQPEEDGAFALHGATRFFGLAGEAVLSFGDERLVRARFEVGDVTRRQADWLEDELRRMGFERSCARREPELRECEWRGRGAVVAILLRARSLSAVVTCEACERPAGTAAQPADAPLAPPVRAAGPDSARAAGIEPVPCLAPDTLVVAGQGRSDRRDPAGLTEAEVVYRPQLVHPAAARAEGVQGRVWVLARVDTAGIVREAKVTRGVAGLDSAALSHVRDTRFRPRLQAGWPCAFWVEIPVVYLLRGRP